MALPFKVSMIFEAFDRMSAPLRKINDKLGRFQKRMKMAQIVTKRSTFSMGRGIKDITTGIIGASVAFAVWDKLILGTIRNGIELEKILISAGTRFAGQNVTKGTEQFRRLTLAARESGATTEFTAIQSAQALEFLALAGFDLNQSIAALPGVLNVASAANLDLARSSDIVTDSLGAFGLMTKDATQLQKNLARVSDVMVATSSAFNTNLEDLFEAAVKGAPIFTTLGGTVEEFGVLAGFMASAGFKGAEAGTAIKRGFQIITSASPKVQKQLKKLGVSVSDNLGNLKRPIDLIRELGEATKNLGGIERTQIFSTLFGARGFGAFLTLARTAPDDLDDMLKKFKNAGGTTIRIATEMRKGLGVQFLFLSSAMQELQLVVFTKIAPALKSAVFAVTDFVRMLAPMKEGVTKPIEPLLKLVGLIIKITFAVKAVALAQFLWNKAIRANPVLAMISVLLILTTLFPDLANKILEWSDVILFAVIAVKSIQAAMALWAFATSSVTGLLILQKIGLIALKGWQLLVAGTMAIVTAAQWAWNIALTANPIGIIVVAIGALIAALVALVVFFPEIVDFFVANWFDVLMLLNPFTAFLMILGKIFPDSIGKLLTKVKNMFSNAFSAVADFLGFGDDEQEINLNKNSNLDINDGSITPSPAAISAARINGRIDVSFSNKPDDVTVSKPSQDGSDDIILETSGA